MTAATYIVRKIYTEYVASIGLSEDAAYIHGTPLRPVVPLDQGLGGLFVIGAYPSARFAQIGTVSNVPVADNLGPFESERWFDGVRVREQPSARELQDLFLTPLKLSRTDCWITDLVKVFLYKTGHIKKYKDLGATAPSGYTRDRFFELGERSVAWLERELEVAKPTLVVTLGAEVAGVLRGVRSASTQVKLLVPEVSPCRIGEQDYPTMHCAHPGILMRKGGGKNPWPERHSKEFIPALRRALRGS
jgi:uracil-DNA glycosylase